MPPKRIRTITPRTASQQQTLSFHGKDNKVTKSQSPRTAKSTKKDPALLESLVSPEAQDVKVEDPSPDLEKQTTAEAAISQQAEDETSTISNVESVLGGRAPQSTAGATGGPANDGWLGDEEARARKVPETQINRYWRAKESERKAPRVHQGDLTTHEKILREWDMQSSYGPCIGIARLKRWKRANALGLEPPIEVLAVLLKEMNEGVTKGQRAHVDELMSSRFIET